MRWPARAGAWLGIGTSPAALVMGAGLAARHGGAIPAAGVVIGAAVVAAMLAVQGGLGLRPPIGEGGPLALVTRRHLGPRADLALQVVLTAAMVGWFAFNVGFGGAGLGEVLSVPAPWGQILLAVTIGAVALGGLRSWNLLAVVTTLASLVLVALVLVAFAAPGLPLTAGVGHPTGWLPDVAVFVGYGAVFALRAPDFSDGLARRRDLAWCVSLLVGSMLLFALAGAALYQGTMDPDVVATIAAGDAATVGNALIAISVVAATFTTLYSGSLAWRAVSGWSVRVSMTGVLLLGLALAAARFDRVLLGWLSTLAVVLPPLLVPIAVVARGAAWGTPLRVRTSMWAPGSATGLAMELMDLPLAVVGALLVAGASTWAQVRRGVASTDV